MTSLHKYIQKHAEEAGYPRLSTVTKPYIQKFLKEQDMKPFKIKYYCEKRDPDFESKMHEVLLVYKQIEMQFDENGDLIVPDDYKLTITVSYDEKPGIQAISNTAPDLRPTSEHGEVYRDAEYKRLGTLSLVSSVGLVGDAVHFTLHPGFLSRTLPDFRYFLQSGKALEYMIQSCSYATCTDCSFGLTISLNIFFGSYVIPFVRIAKITLSILQVITINDCNFFSGLSFRVV